MDVATATSESFEPAVGQVFRLAYDGGEIALTLDNIKILPENTKRDSKLVIDGQELPVRHPFALTFEGPLDPSFRQGTFQLSHEELGEFHTFLTLFRRDQSCCLYEAVFT